MFSMPKELRTAWLAALRGDEYKQCKLHLAAGEEGNMGYCCLGVLQMVADGKVQHVDDPSDPDYGTPAALPTIGWYQDHGFRDIGAYIGADNSTSNDPYSVEVPIVTEESLRRRDIYGSELEFSNQSLSYLNDDCDYTFKQIADFIEEGSQEH